MSGGGVVSPSGAVSPQRSASSGLPAPLAPRDQSAHSALDASPAPAELTGDAHAARILELMATGFIALARDWTITYVNSEAERILGRGRELLLGRDLWEEFPGAEDLDFGREYTWAMAGEPRSFEAFYPGLGLWFEIRAVPSEDGIGVYFLDVSARKDAEAATREVLERFELLAGVSAELSGTLDATVAVGRLAELVVPALADWCLVTLVEEANGHQQAQLRDVGSWHVDPAMRETLSRYAQVRHAAMTDESFISVALRTGTPQIVGRDVDAAISSVMLAGPATELLRELAPGAGAVFPLVAAERIVGVLTLYNGVERGRFSDPQLATAGEVAARAALAVNNARLFTQQRRLAEGLQRSLLTAPPEPDHMQIVVRYEPAAEAAQVGGDWYDAFLQRHGETVIVIGDVIGHDTAAAAAMGQVRSLLRGIAARTGDSPKDVLVGVDEVIETLQVNTTASVIVARFEQTEDERDRGVTRMRWSNAGHPPPMVINPDGSVLVLADVDADVLLGVDPSSDRRESVVALDRGSTILLFTDGLVERRGQSLDEGLHQLREALAACAGFALDDLCDAVVQRLQPAQPEDDVALVAVRLHRQDRPRPAEAGPRRVPAPFTNEHG